MVTFLFGLCTILVGYNRLCYRPIIQETSTHHSLDQDKSTRSDLVERCSYSPPNPSPDLKLLVCHSFTSPVWSFIRSNTGHSRPVIGVTVAAGERGQPTDRATRHYGKLLRTGLSALRGPSNVFHNMVQPSSYHQSAGPIMALFKT